jgi:hypothetical protein
MILAPAGDASSPGNALKGKATHARPKTIIREQVQLRGRKIRCQPETEKPYRYRLPFQPVLISASRIA